MSQGPSRVEWCLRALEDDKARRGGVLEDTDVHRLISQLQLSSEDTRAVWLNVENRSLVTDRSREQQTAERVGATSRDADAVDDLLSDVGLLPFLSAEEEIRLARRWQSARKLLGDAEETPTALPLLDLIQQGLDARERLICSNLRLVLWVAREYEQVTEVRRDDLVQMGILGLIHATDKYDPELGFRFSTYASVSTKRAILRGLSEAARTIRLPPNVLKQLSSLSKSRRTLRGRLGRSPNILELAQDTGFTQSHIHFLNLVRQDAISFDAPGPGDDSGRSSGPPARASRAPDPSMLLERAEEQQLLRQTVDDLDSRSRMIVRHRLSLDGVPFLTLEQLGEVLDLTRERVRQLERKALIQVTAECRRLMGSECISTALEEVPPDAK
jgi:RNA polymerase primary sigma factor